MFSLGALWLIVYFICALALQWRNGVYQAGFGAFPDESGHYVTGLMVYKYLTKALGTNPMIFAERFYAHYPAVGFGHWPPVFYIVQAVWGVLFGLSRNSELVLMAALAAITGAMIYHAGKARIGVGYAGVVGLVFLLLPIVQLHSGTVMAELPLTIFSFAAVLAFAKLIEAPSFGRAMWSGFWLAGAILVKGNAWALTGMALCAPFLSEAPLRFIKRYGWIPFVPVIVFSVPFNVLTLKMAKDGFEQDAPTWKFFRAAIHSFVNDHLFMLGIPLVGLALIGVYITIFRPWWNRSRADRFWLLQVVVVGSVLLFHSLVPTSVEARKLFMSIPSLLLLAAIGCKHIVSLLPSRIPSSIYASAAALLVVAPFLTHANQRQHRNMGAAAQEVLGMRSLDHSALMVASTSLDEREELSFVAEVAAREEANFGHAVIRAGKLLADSSWNGTEYTLRYQNADMVENSLSSIPVSAIVTYMGKVRRNSHAALVREVVAENNKWMLLSAWPEPPGAVELYMSLDRPAHPVRLPQIDLRRKIGRSVSSEF
jgi:hypothetical protein